MATFPLKPFSSKKGEETRSPLRPARLEVLGEFLPRPQARPETLSEEVREDVLRELLRYEIEPGFWVGASLPLQPTRTPPRREGFCRSSKGAIPAGQASTK